MSKYEIGEDADSLLGILEELSSIVENAKSMPFSASVMVNREEVLELLDTAQDIMPAEIVKADSVLQNVARVADEARDEAERKVAQAKIEAEQILAQAREQAAQLVAEHAVTISAQSEAEKILDEARMKADKVTQGADTYSDETLEELSDRLSAVQEYLDQIQSQVLAGRDLLAERIDHDAYAEDEYEEYVEDE